MDYLKTYSSLFGWNFRNCLASEFFFAPLAREGKRKQITEIKGEGMIAG